MPEGKIEQLTDRGFGFIRSASDGNKYFFHSSGVAKGCSFKGMKQGQKVSFNLRSSEKKPGQQDAFDVRPIGDAAQVRVPPGPTPVTTMLPYGFVPIDVDRAIADTPVWHDGADGGQLLSGEILCTLEAMTPLLPGNARYPVRKDGKDDGLPLANDTLKGILRTLGGREPKAGKQIAEPLLLSDGRVVIPGTSLKGMIRQSLGALLSAPMERVDERRYTYRPNLDLRMQGTPDKVVRPALVVAQHGGTWSVEVFDDARAADFVRSNAKSIINSAARGGIVTGMVLNIRRENNRIFRQVGSTATLKHRVAIYKGGIDGQGLLAGTFNPPTTIYDVALVPTSGLCTLDIPIDLYQRYLADQSEVLANAKTGHLTAHPHHGLNVERTADAINSNAALQVNQLIYVELTTDRRGDVTSSSIILSFGHHFRYRWAYTSSVRVKKNKPRPCLTPRNYETDVPPANANDTDVPPERLTGARLLFGYVRDSDNPIGKGVYERLAGRIAINHAVSIEKDPARLFLGEKAQGYCIPLKILGQPKSSAWEFYLQQDPSRPPATYGDLPGDDGGELAGRKFYRHQPRCQGVADIAETDLEKIHSDQATLARYICKGGTQFKFTLRFSGLRLWELGALLVTMQPHRIMRNPDPTKYAHKLGLGRPLGMGSVRIGIDRIGIRCQSETHLTYCLKEQPGTESQTELDAKQALLRQIRPNESRHLSSWVKLHEYSLDGERELDYPHGPDGAIFTWHTERRKDYSQLRRQKSPDWTGLHNTIRERLFR